MAQANIIQREITVATPLKIEIVHLQAPNTGDTFFSNLVRPLFVLASASQITGNTLGATAQITTNTKLVTIGVWDGSTNMTVLLFGY